MSKIQTLLATGNFVMKKRAPAILTGVGMTLVVGATILSGTQSLKLEGILDSHKEKLEMINSHAGQNIDTGDERGIVTYTEADAKEDRQKLIILTGWRIVKLYGPVVALEAAGLACIIGGHTILSNRFAALTAAYTAVQEAFKTYKERIIYDHGEEYDRDVRNGVYRTMKEVEVTNEDDKTTTQMTEIAVIDPDKRSDAYSRFFDESSRHWVKNAALNLSFLKGIQNMCNDRLMARGYLLLNEVYEMLDIPPTTAGSLIGWVVGKGKHNYVDFGIFDMTSAEKRAFVNGYERSILLNFNVDGPIYMDIDKLRR